MSDGEGGYEERDRREAEEVLGRFADAVTADDVAVLCGLLEGSAARGQGCDESIPLVAPLLRWAIAGRPDVLLLEFDDDHALAQFPDFSGPSAGDDRPLVNAPAGMPQHIALESGSEGWRITELRYNLQTIEERDDVKVGQSGKAPSGRESSGQAEEWDEAEKAVDRIIRRVVKLNSLETCPIGGIRGRTTACGSSEAGPLWLGVRRPSGQSRVRVLEVRGDRAIAMYPNSRGVPGHEQLMVLKRWPTMGWKLAEQWPNDPHIPARG